MDQVQSTWSDRVSGAHTDAPWQIFNFVQHVIRWIWRKFYFTLNIDASFNKGICTEICQIISSRWSCRQVARSIIAKVNTVATRKWYTLIETRFSWWNVSKDNQVVFYYVTANVGSPANWKYRWYIIIKKKNRSINIFYSRYKTYR